MRLQKEAIFGGLAASLALVMFFWLGYLVLCNVNEQQDASIARIAKSAVAAARSGASAGSNPHVYASERSLWLDAWVKEKERMAKP